LQKLTRAYQKSFFQVSNGNVTVLEPKTGRGLYQYESDFGLFQALKGAGSSFGIITEFVYQIYPRPETLPTIILIYVEDQNDIRNLERAAMDGRYHLTWYVIYPFREMETSFQFKNVLNWRIGIGIKYLLHFLKITAGAKINPILVQVVDNAPEAGRYTGRYEAMEFLEEFGIKLAMTGIFANFIPNDVLDVHDYESLYMSDEEIGNEGLQGIATANLMGLSSQSIMDDFIFTHPLFGMHTIFFSNSF